MSSEPETGPETAGGSPDRGAPETAGRKPEPGRALVEFVPPKPRAGFVWRKQQAVWAAGLLLALGAAGAGLESVRAFTSTHDETQASSDATAQLLHRLQDDVGRLKGTVDTLRTAPDSSKQDDAIRNLKKSVENLRQEIEQTRSTATANVTQLSSKIDKADHDPSQKLAEIMARLDKLDHGPKDKGGDAAEAQKLADVTSRLDRIERQVSSSATTASIPTASSKAAVTVAAAAARTAPSAPAPVPAAKPAAKAETQEAKAVPPRSPTVDGWVVRDVYDGMALVEGRDGLREISPGEFLPGAGEVQAIQRRGRSWVVLTDRGVIGNNTW